MFTTPPTLTQDLQERLDMEQDLELLLMQKTRVTGRYGECTVDHDVLTISSGRFEILSIKRISHKGHWTGRHTLIVQSCSTKKQAIYQPSEWLLKRMTWFKENESASFQFLAHWNCYPRTAGAILTLRVEKSWILRHIACWDLEVIPSFWSGWISY